MWHLVASLPFHWCFDMKNTKRHMLPYMFNKASWLTIWCFGTKMVTETLFNGVEASRFGGSCIIHYRSIFLMCRKKNRAMLDTPLIGNWIAGRKYTNNFTYTFWPKKIMLPKGWKFVSNNNHLYFQCEQNLNHVWLLHIWYPSTRPNARPLEHSRRSTHESIATTQPHWKGTSWVYSMQPQLQASTSRARPYHFKQQLQNVWRGVAEETKVCTPAKLQCHTGQIGDAARRTDHKERCGGMKHTCTCLAIKATWCVRSCRRTCWSNVDAVVR